MREYEQKYFRISNVLLLLTCTFLHLDAPSFSWCHFVQVLLPTICSLSMSLFESMAHPWLPQLHCAAPPTLLHSHSNILILWHPIQGYGHIQTKSYYLHELIPWKSLPFITPPDQNLLFFLFYFSLSLNLWTCMFNIFGPYLLINKGLTLSPISQIFRPML